MPFRIGNQFTWVLLGRAIAAVLQAVLLLLIVQYVSPGEFGLLAAILGFLTVAQSGLDLGLPAFAMRERAHDGRSPAVVIAIRLNSITSSALAAVLLLVFVLLGLMVDEFYVMMMPLALSAAFERIVDARLGVAISDGDAYKNFIGLVSRRAVAIGIFIVLTESTSSHPVAAFGIATAVGAGASLLFAWAFVKIGRSSTRTWNGTRAVLREARAYWVNSIATQLRNIDTTIVVLAAGVVQGGFYGLASRLTVPLRMPASSLGQVLLPAAARASARADLVRVVRLGALAALACAAAYLATLFFIPVLVRSFLPAEYVHAIVVVQMVLIGVMFAAVSSLLAPVLQGVGEKRFVAIVSTCTTVVVLASVAVAGFYGGAIGAAVALGAAFVAQSVVLVWKTVQIVRQMKG